MSTSEVRPAARYEPTAESDPPEPEMALGIAYARAVEQAGGVPVVMPPLATELADPLLDRLDGICLSGGPDIDPEAYGAARHPHLGPTQRMLDRFELAVARGALERDLPLLAICRGAQVLNVATGGTLHQHLPDQVPSPVQHRQHQPGSHAVHDVAVASNSRLARILHAPRTRVNSFHHQAADRLGRGVRAVAWADDDVVEAIELPERDFVVGVQWHAECLVDRHEQRALFDAFIEAARRQQGAQPARPRVVA